MGSQEHGDSSFVGADSVPTGGTRLPFSRCPTKREFVEKPLEASGQRVRRLIPDALASVSAFAERGHTATCVRLVMNGLSWKTEFAGACLGKWNAAHSNFVIGRKC
jgi:hypothetical protein